MTLLCRESLTSLSIFYMRKSIWSSRLFDIEKVKNPIWETAKLRTNIRVLRRALGPLRTIKDPCFLLLFLLHTSIAFREKKSVRKWGVDATEEDQRHTKASLFCSAKTNVVAVILTIPHCVGCKSRFRKDLANEITLSMEKQLWRKKLI